MDFGVEELLFHNGDTNVTRKVTETRKQRLKLWEFSSSFKSNIWSYSMLQWYWCDYFLVILWHSTACCFTCCVRVAESLILPQTVEKLLKLLATLERWIDETPPIDQPSRFGNKAYRTWYSKLDQVSIHTLSETHPLMTPVKAAGLTFVCVWAGSRGPGLSGAPCWQRCSICRNSGLS